MKKILVFMLIAVIGLSCVFAGCGQQLNFGKELIPYKSQLDALTQLNQGTVDVAIIDSVMAGYYTSTGDFAQNLQMINGLVFAEEQYGIAAKKGNDALISKINEGLIALADTDYKAVAQTYGLTESLLITSATANPNASATDNSWNEIVADKKLIIGYTVFAPIAYTEADVFKGFDIDLAKAVVAYLNETYSAEIVIEFQVIDWNSKETLLENGSIDLVWNGMTITPERSAEMCISVPYLANKQVAVIAKADANKFTNKDSLKDAIIAVESGSAGEGVVVKK